MSEAPPLPPIRWCAPTRRLTLPDSSAPARALAAWLTPEDRAAGVADELVERATQAGAVEDARAVSLSGGPPTLHDLKLWAGTSGWAITLRPNPGRAGALAALAAEAVALAEVQRRLRHDVRAPVSLAREALGTHPGARDPEGLEAIALDTLARVSRVADTLGRGGPAAAESGWVDLALLADLALALGAPWVRARGLRVTRGVLPAIVARPAARLHALSAGLRDAGLGVPKGGHLHLVALWDADGVSLRFRRVDRA